jgi:hypothetical protein
MAIARSIPPVLDEPANLVQQKGKEPAEKVYVPRKRKFSLILWKRLISK